MVTGRQVMEGGKKGGEHVMTEVWHFENFGCEGQERESRRWKEED